MPKLFKSSPATSNILMERVSTGVSGLDELISGGYVKGSVNLISGTTGTGKTMFCTSFIWEGVKQDQPGIYATAEQTADSLLHGAKLVGMDFEPYIKSKKCTFLNALPNSFKEFETSIINEVKRIGAKRLVLDSLSVILMSTEEFPEIVDGIKFHTVGKPRIRRMLFNFTEKLRDLGVTSLFISEIPALEPNALSRFGFEEFVADSIFVLRIFEYAGGDTPRSMQVRKMRETKHSTDVHPIEISENGIRLLLLKRGIVI